MNSFISFLVICYISIQDVRPELMNMKIVDEPSSYGLNNAVGGIYGQNTDTLKMKVKPANFSGPPHFERMKGKCFSTILESYKYELCPFSNITQYEQSLRWNPYSGILGIWQEWEIENNTFVAMVMKNGDNCNDRNREVKVYFRCGQKTEILNASEPSTCTYHLLLQTPLVCPKDSMLVYPVLSRELQIEWDAIETSLFYQELTEKGYKKKLQQLFEKAGFYLSSEKKELLKLTEDVEKSDFVSLDNNSRFKTQAKCEKEYEKLEQENERLRKILSDNGLLSEDNGDLLKMNSTHNQVNAVSEEKPDNSSIHLNAENIDKTIDSRDQQNIDKTNNQQNIDNRNNQQNIDNINNQQNSDKTNNQQNIDNINNQKNIDNINNQQNIDNINNQQNIDNINNQQNIDYINNQQNIDNINKQQNIDNVNNQQNIDYVNNPQNIANINNQQNIDNINNQQNIANINKQQNIDIINNQQNIDNINKQQNIANINNQQNIANINNQQNIANINNQKNIANINNQENIDNINKQQNIDNINNQQNIDNINNQQNIDNINNQQNIENNVKSVK